jgi:predicted enzyme related to lactoylglutathione lyase
MNTPNYLELKTPDIEASKAFYAKAFGFKFVDYGPGYAGVNGKHVEIGFHQSDEREPPLAGFQTDDIAKARETVVAAGGEIVQETYEFPGGRRFHFRDPGGNELLVYQYDA